MGRLFKSSLSLFDVDLAYAYADALCEVDGLYWDDEVKGLILFEELSRAAEECLKELQRLLLGSSYPPTLWRGDSQELQRLGESVRILRAAELQCESREGLWSELVRLVYDYASEAANALLYSHLVLSPWAAERIVGDVLRSGGGAAAGDVLKGFAQALRDGSVRVGRDEVEAAKEWEERVVSRKRGEIAELLGEADMLLIYPQLGTRAYSAEGLAKLVKSLRCCVIKRLRKIVVVSNEYLRQRSPKELEEIKRQLSREFEHADVEVEERDVSRVLDVLREANHAVALVAQDYHKKFLADLVANVALSAKTLRGIIVIPESFYITDEQQRVVRAVGGFAGKVLKGACDELERVLALRSVVMTLG